MLVAYLQRVSEFAELPGAELNALARQVSVVCVPGGRRLVGPEQPVDDYLYLLRGTLDIGGRRMRASRFGAVCHFYPGVESAKTRSSCQIVRMRRQLHEFVSHGGSTGTVYGADSTPWLKRFLSSPIMRRLSSAEWQAFLRGFSAVQFEQGEHVVIAGDAADSCYVIEAGHAVVHHCGQTLCHLNPGDFFGEDALIAGLPRNATVTALSPLKVQRIDGDRFLQALVSTLVEFVDQRGVGETFALSGTPDAGLRKRLDEVPLSQPIYVTGGNRAERALVTFLLLQRGHQARAVT